MNQTIRAVFENGIFRPLRPVELDDGVEVEMILTKRNEPDPEESRAILDRIAALPLESDDDGFSCADHDDILYPKTEQ